MGELVNECARDVWVCGCLNWWYEYFIVKCYELLVFAHSFESRGDFLLSNPRGRWWRRRVRRELRRRNGEWSQKNMAPPGLFLDIISHLFIQQIVIELGSPLKHTEVNNMYWLSKNVSLKRKWWPPPNQDPNPKMLDFKCRRPTLTPRITNAQKIN